MVITGKCKGHQFTKADNLNDLKNIQNMKLKKEVDVDVDYLNYFLVFAILILLNHLTLKIVR